MRPLCIDLYCGLGGWAEGFLAEGYDVVGFDNGHTAPYAHGSRYPGQLVIQDVLTLHGSQFRDAAVIVASPPCQNYSYLAMPWSRSKSEHSQKAKALRRKWETEGPDNRLFDACFRIQREACEAAGRYIPLIVENVRGAQPWVGRSAWNYGSFHLWGDVPALMPVRFGGQKVAVYSDPRRNGGKASHLTSPGENALKLEEGLKIGGDRFSDPQSTCRKHGSRSNARKLASALIAKIPFELASHIARTYYPRSV